MTFGNFAACYCQMRKLMRAIEDLASLFEVQQMCRGNGLCNADIAQMRMLQIITLHTMKGTLFLNYCKNGL